MKSSVITDNQMSAIKNAMSMAGLKPRLECFTAHGHEWTPHTPGNPMPVEAGARVQVLLRNRKTKTQSSSMLCWLADDSGDYKGVEIVGWRYASPPQEPDALQSEIQQLATTPNICPESVALINAALAVQSGKISLTDAIKQLTQP